MSEFSFFNKKLNIQIPIILFFIRQLHKYLNKIKTKHSFSRVFCFALLASIICRGIQLIDMKLYYTCNQKSLSIQRCYKIYVDWFLHKSKKLWRIFWRPTRLVS